MAMDFKEKFPGREPADIYLIRHTSEKTSIASISVDYLKRLILPTNVIVADPSGMIVPYEGGYAILALLQKDWTNEKTLAKAVLDKMVELQNTDGSWYQQYYPYKHFGKYEDRKVDSGTATGSVSLDSGEKAVGSYSVKHSTTTADYYGCAVFTLNAGKEINCNTYPSLTFQVMEESGFSGAVTMQLEDSAGMIVRQEFRISNNKKWHLQTFMAGRKHSDQWTHSLFNTQPFDWTKVKKLSFFCHFSGTGSFWVDNLFFGKCRWSGVAEDTSSQSRHGLRELAIVDETLVSDDACAKVADAELKYRKDPAEFLRVTVLGNPQIKPGETIRVVSPNENIDADYRLQAVDHYMDDEGEFESHLTLIAEPPRVATILAETRGEMDVLRRGTAYRKLGR